jgi:hypothetical protein
MYEHDDRLRVRHEQRLGGGGRALVTPTGRVIAGELAGLAESERIALPPGGGELRLSSGIHAFAEALGYEEAYIVTPVQRTHSQPRRAVLRLHLLDRDRGKAELDGKAIELSRRHSEILALLSTRHDGISSEELAADLYGDAGRPGAARVQVHRLRKLIGDAIETDPYRLSAGVESDFSRIHGLLARGSVREAAERYEGPLLPHSEAPGIVREREALDSWLRQAVMTSDDDDALWAWVQSRGGSDDLGAWKRLLSHLEFHDERRSLAAATVAALRSAYR